MKSFFRQQFIQVIARDAPRNLRKSCSYLCGVLVSDRPQLGVNLAATSDLFRDSIKLAIRRCTDSHLRAVIQQNPELLDVVDSLAAEQRVRAAGLVPTHSADGAA